MADDDSVLSDVDEDPSPIVLPSSVSSTAADHRIRDLLAELDQERRDRKAAEDARSDLQISVNRLKAFAQEVLKKRDEAVRDKDESARSADRAAAELSEALKLKDEALKQRDEALQQKEEALLLKDSLRSEVETAAHMLVTGIEKISGKVSAFKNFAAGGLPRSQKYTGMPAVSYGVIKRANEIVEELVKHVDAATKSRDQSREQVEQRNYEIAIEVSQLEATIGGLRDDVSSKASEIESLEKAVAERDAKISAMDQQLSELRQFGDDCSSKLRGLEVRVESQRPLLIDQLNYISKTYQQIQEILRITDVSASEQFESASESSFMWQELGFDDNLRTLLEGTVSVYKLAKVAEEKVREKLEARSQEVKALDEKVTRLLAEKQHIVTLLRSALSLNGNEVLQAAENGLREVGIDVRFNGHDQNGLAALEGDEVYTLAGALENTVKSSQLEIIELEHLVEALRAESSLLKAHMDAQAMELGQLKIQIKELKEKEKVANESVEGLMSDIITAEEEIARWKAAAEQEAAAGSSVEQEFLSQLSALRKELDETKQVMVEMANKLKFKEETAAAAMAARNAAENSLRLADIRSTRLREKVEELTQQLEESDVRTDSREQNSHRYMCWPWQWLGLNFVRYHALEESSNEMELAEPLV